MSSQNNFFKGMNGWSELIAIFFLCFIGLIISTLIISKCISISVNNSLTKIELAHIIESIFLFLLPAFAFAKLFQNSIQSYLHLSRIKNSRIIWFILLLVIIAQPIIQILTYYNEQMVLPHCLHNLEIWMRLHENEAEATIKLFLKQQSILGYISNIVIIAALAGFVEEIFFRGCIYQIFKKLVRNKHAAIWITAFIFSAIHIQFYGFIPRFLLGALLGYLFVWSGNIWISIIAHMFHNAINVIVMQVMYRSNPNFDLDKSSNSEYTLIIAIICLILFIFLLKNIKTKLLKDNYKISQTRD